LKCPYCNHPETSVIESRESEDFRVRRRRECMGCKKRFTTYEEAQVLDMQVVKKDGRREQFDKKKLISGLHRAFEKRPVSSETIEKIADAVERQVRHLKSVDVPSKKIGEMVMRKIRAVDDVAYIRFASVYYSFEDSKSFEGILREMRKKERGNK
jgi:transcriptional repressor NrdR